MGKTKITITEAYPIKIEFSNEEDRKAFFEFTIQSDIYPSIRGGFSGPSGHMGFYSKKDMKTIKEFLEQKK